MIRICTFKLEGKEHVGVVTADDRIADYSAACESRGKTGASTVIEFLRQGNAAMELAAEISEKGFGQFAYRQDEVELLAPIPRPNKFLCLAVNYNTHKREGEKEEKVTNPKDIHVFTKTNLSACAPNSNLVFSKELKYLDYELELGIVIGKDGRYIPREKAAEHIAGYIAANDIGNREFMPQMSGNPIHWFAMKALDFSAPYGPFLLMKEGVKFEDLEISLWVNGELRQHCRPAEDILWRPEAVVSRISEWTTLETGDVIILGTPAGNGWSRQDFLRDGDTVSVELNLCGKFRNKIVFENPEYRTTIIR